MRFWSLVRRGLWAFGRFWWDFLVGDTPELLVGALAVVGLAVALAHHGVVALIVVPLVATAAVATSAVGKVLRQRRGPRTG